MDEKLILNPHVYPHGGFVFVDQDKIKHTGNSFGELVSNLREFRLRIGAPLGNPVLEVNAQICAKDPSACRKVGEKSKELRKQTAAVSIFSTRVIQWLVRTADAASRQRFQMLTKQKADERGKICAKCPRNIPWRTGCGGCTAAYLRTGLAIRRGVDSKWAPVLGACEVLTECLRTNVFLPLKPVENANLPTNCWRKK